VLSRHNRIVEPGDFRQVVRRGDKQVTAHLIVYRRPSELNRVGVIVTAKCGNAVVRNTLRRRTRAITRTLIDRGVLTGDVIIRFRCEGSVPSFAELKAEIDVAAGAWGRP
jgi:ribonuclease P protein component